VSAIVRGDRWAKRDRRGGQGRLAGGEIDSRGVRMQSRPMEGVEAQRAIPSEPVQGEGEGETHSFVVTGTKFTVPRRYELIKPIGHGAYGVVV